MAVVDDALRRLATEKADAWFEYVESTRGQPPDRYATVEPWAWAQLQQRLRAIASRRRKLEPK